MEIEDPPEPEVPAGPGLNELLTRFAVSDPQNTQQISFDAFNQITNDLGIEGSLAPDLQYVDGVITLAEACAVAGIIVPDLPVGLNVLATYFRMAADSEGMVDLPQFLKQLSYCADCPANPEDVQCTFEEVVDKMTGPPCELKLNVIKDGIRRWSKEGNYRLDSDEVRQLGRFYELDLTSDAMSWGLKELLPFIITDTSKPCFTTGIDMDELMKAFEWCDPDHVGSLSSDDLAKAMRLGGQNPSQGEFRKLKVEMDTNQDGRFDFDEFTAICCASFVPPEEQRRKAMLSFDVFDVNKTGMMPVSELKRIFSTYGEDMAPEEIENLFTELRLEEDAVLDVSDFVTLLLS